MSKGDKRRPETLLAHLGRNPSAHFGTVNTPVYHASTLIRESVEAYEEAGRNRWVKGKSSYGRSGTPVAVNGQRMKPAQLIQYLNTLGSKHGIGPSRRLSTPAPESPASSTDSII
ncbi:MAG TPA: hypothetical protein EYP07_04310 [Kiloniellaceae bacterium]|nr:hypothetical protein [Kiloniellaceae bacterium]